MKELVAVILAAGYGKRMNSKLPKVMHEVCGKSMVGHVMTAAEEAGASRSILIVSPETELFSPALGDSEDFVIQKERMGTGHAVMQAIPALKKIHGDVLVLLGDMPLLPGAQLRKLVDAHKASKAQATVLTALLEDATGYGRIVRDDDGNVLRIVEHRDATEAEKAIREINTGVFCFDSQELIRVLSELTPDNDQKEYYLTDTVGIMNRLGQRVSAIVCDKPEYGMGVNSRVQLAEAAAVMRKRILIGLMESGVTITDPSTTYIDSGVSIGRDTVIEPFTFLQGRTSIGEDCVIGPDSKLVGATVGRSVMIRNSIVLESSIGDGCNIGPFAYIRPDSVLHENVKVGDFVELKKAEIMRGSKIPHLSYVGDATVGEDANLGCGTITCNYDGKGKHRTIIGDRAFVGSNSNLVAPVTIGSDSFVAAGSTITKDVPSHALAVGRARQEVKENWRKRKAGVEQEKDNH